MGAAIVKTSKGYILSNVSVGSVKNEFGEGMSVIIPARTPEGDAVMKIHTHPAESNYGDWFGAFSGNDIEHSQAGSGTPISVSLPSARIFQYSPGKDRVTELRRRVDKMMKTLNGFGR